ncbi:MAG: NUDIX domain-containing protein [Bacteroidetes bacterium]|nr:NUDIX domain-containing protein [Bacteroidota bacterium]
MRLFFVRNIPIEISSDEDLRHIESFDYFLEGKIDNIGFSKIKGKVLIKADQSNFSNWIRIIMIKGNHKLERITFLIQNMALLMSYIKDKYAIVNAAGGVVIKNKDILMVHRAGKWELPKGKLEKNETFEEAAIREIKEECNVSTEIIDDLCSTWYTYMIKGKIFFKHVIWFNMLSVNDDNMKPQIEEGITKVAWISPCRLDSILSRSYLSIGYVIDEYFKKLDNGRT